MDCNDSPHLTLFLKPNSDRAVLAKELEAWARRESTISGMDTRMLH